MNAQAKQAQPQVAAQGQQQVHPAAVAQEFMKRSDMKGGEVEVYAQTFNWLQSILEGELSVVTTEELKASTEKVAELEVLIKSLEENVQELLTDSVKLKPLDINLDELDQAEDMISEGGPVELELVETPEEELEDVESE